MTPNTFTIPSLPQTHPVPVTELTWTDLFASTTAVITVLDPDGIVRSTLRFLPDHSRITFEVADARKGYLFKNASLLALEMAVCDDHASMMWTAAKGDVAEVPLTE